LSASLRGPHSLLSAAILPKGQQATQTSLTLYLIQAKMSYYPLQWCENMKTLRHSTSQHIHIELDGNYLFAVVLPKGQQATHTSLTLYLIQAKMSYYLQWCENVKNLRHSSTSQYIHIELDWNYLFAVVLPKGQQATQTSLTLYLIQAKMSYYNLQWCEHSPSF
jgi:hypothetical protein